MSELVDRVGKKYGYLTVIDRAENSKDGKSRWVCACKCGNITVVSGGNLHSGAVRSCGCLRHKFAKRSKHGMTGTSLYNIWAKMKCRCLNKSDKAYKDYGGRGICICEDWMDPSKFFEWAKASGYKNGLTIERVDVDGNYCPNNCKWIPKAEQSNNRRSSVLIEINGVTKNLQQWCEEYGIEYKLAHARIRKLGWDPITALTKPKQVHSRLEVNK